LWSELRGVLLGGGRRQTQSVPATRGTAKEAAAAAAAAAGGGDEHRSVSDVI